MFTRRVFDIISGSSDRYRVLLHGLFASTVSKAVQLFLVLCFILMYVKPSFLYDTDTGSLKLFGTEKNQSETLLSFSIVIFFLAVVSYYIAVMTEP